MVAVITNPFRVANAKAFIDTFTSNPTYMAAGRTRPWTPTAVTPDSDDANPPIPVDSNAELVGYLRELIGAKRISAADVSTAIPRHNWTSGTVYAQYDSRDQDITSKNMYVIINNPLSASHLYVYKCIDNNGGTASTVAPSGSSAATIGPLADGYKWKFMFSIAESRFAKFATSKFIPISEAPAASLQEAVHLSATPGTIDNIKVTNGGTGYSSAPTVTISGDGTGATATAFVSGDAITSIRITAPGSGYTYANLTIGGPGTGGAAYANVAPPGGHGSDALKELGAYYVVMSAAMEYDEGGKISTKNDVRSIVVIRNPKNNTNSAFTDMAANLTTRLTMTSVSGAFDIDELVTSSTGATGYVVEYNSETKVLSLNDVKGTFLTSTSVTGGTSGETATISTIAQPDMKFLTGDVFYVETRLPQERGETQAERYNIVVQW